MTTHTNIAQKSMFAATLGATLGDGLDQFRETVGPQISMLVPNDFGGWVLSVAVFVTVWSIIKVIRQLWGPVGGAGDAGALVSYGVNRAVIAVGARAPAVAWGAVRDSDTGAPLPLATVRLVAADGDVVASCVSDPHGRYGFRMPYPELVTRGYWFRMETRKSGYYPTRAPRELALLAGAYPAVDIAMDRAAGNSNAGATPEGALARTVGTAAFWVGMVAVPMKFMNDPGWFNGLLLGAFFCVVVIRAILSKHHR